MSTYYEEGTSPQGLHRFMPSTRVSCLLATRILPISNEVGREIIEYVGNLAKMDVVYVPVNYHRFANADKGNIREELGFDSITYNNNICRPCSPCQGLGCGNKGFCSGISKISEGEDDTGRRYELL